MILSRTLSARNELMTFFPFSFHFFFFSFSFSQPEIESPHTKNNNNNNNVETAVIDHSFSYLRCTPSAHHSPTPVEEVPQTYVTGDLDTDVSNKTEFFESQFCRQWSNAAKRQSKSNQSTPLQIHSLARIICREK